jgi:hypothetical protein
MAEQLLFSTVRIESEMGVGTGFLLQVQLNFGGSFIFLITNKHVISGANKIKFFFTKGEATTIIEEDNKKNKLFSKEEKEIKKEILPILGEKYECDLAGKEWFNHPDISIDLTLMNISSILNKISQEGNRVFIRTIPLEFIPTKEDIEELDALENILFIGYPIGIYDKKNLFPIIRRGITATPVYSNYEGKSLFLIDASVFPGSSGSPVFVYDKGSFKTRDGTTNIGDRIYFVGVISETIIRNDKGELEFIDIPTKLTPIIKKSEMIDLGIVIKSEKVKELIDLYLEELNKKNKDEN